MSEYGAPATAEHKDHHLRWPNFAKLRHEQAKEADPIEVPADYPKDAPIPVAEGARFGPPRPDRPAVALPTSAAAEGEGIRVTGEDEPVGTGTEKAAEVKPRSKAADAPANT